MLYIFIYHLHYCVRPLLSAVVEEEVGCIQVVDCRQVGCIQVVDCRQAVDCRLAIGCRQVVGCRQAVGEGNLDHK